MAKVKAFQNTDTTISVDENSSDADVTTLQKMLERYGYLRPGSYEVGTYDQKTEHAVRKYQRFNKLTVDGVAGGETKTELAKPRCIHPDLSGGASGAYVMTSAYPTSNLTYAFENDPADLPAETAKTIIREQFAKWAAVCKLSFTEVTTAQNPHLRIAWKKGDHNDGEAFDGAGNVLAHAFYPPPTGGAHAGQLHFDEDETYSIDGSDGTIKLAAVALHEIGHLIGLNHSNDSNAVMWPSYSSDKTELHEDDENGAKDLYGISAFTHTASLTDSLSGPGESDTWKLEDVAEGDMEVVLDCLSDGDFDLYVKFNDTASETNFDYRSWSVGDEELLIFNNPAGYASFHVVSYQGSGDYKLSIRANFSS